MWNLLSRPANAGKRVRQFLVAVYLLAALVAFVVIPFNAITWLQVPFLGGFIEPNLVFDNIGPISQSSWPAYDQNLRFDVQLTQIESKPVVTSADVAQGLSHSKPGQTVSIQVRDTEGNLLSLAIPLVSLSVIDQWGYFLIPYLVGLVFLATGLWIFGARRNQTSGLVFTVFTTSVAVATAGLFDIHSTHNLIYLWSIAVPLAGASIVHFGLIFPRPFGPIQRRRWFQILSYLISIGLIIFSVISLIDSSHPLAYATAWSSEKIFVATCLTAFFSLTLYRYVSSGSQVEHEQVRVILFGSIAALVPPVLWPVISQFIPNFKFGPFLLLTLLAFPVVIIYIFQRFHQLQVEYILSRTTLYGLLTVLAALSYMLLAYAASLVASTPLPANHPLLIGAIVILLVLVLNPLRTRLQNAIDRLFFRSESNYQNLLQTFDRDLENTPGFPGNLKIIRQTVEQSILPTQLHIFIYDPFADLYSATPGLDGKPTSDMRFTGNSHLAEILSKSLEPFYTSNPESIPANLKEDRNRLALLAAELIIPLPGRDHLTGWLALGARRSGESYTSHQLRFLGALANRAAQAIERVQAFSRMENRVREMNTLTRVAQGVNITPSFDDILELIYAQTSQIIPIHDFTLTLFDRKTNTYQHAFYLEDDERLPERENKPLSQGEGLEHEVIHSGRSLMTEDYQQECHQRDIRPISTHIYAWMGVPLNGADETIGALSLGNHDQDVIFTGEQLALVQAIADQAAGAITKSRLLAETEQRARQLATLNEVTRLMASTLDPELLLHYIIQSATDILNCEAGSLLMVDDQTNELVFRVTVGPVASDLIGTRLPPGSGIVGKAVITQQPLIVNNVHSTPDWFATIDNKTGFTTQSLLVIPLFVKDKIIGVIEILNKRDGLGFSQDDLALLSAFASQASVALENARLYTMTDKALAARVEELSVMQRIDRELNTSLDITQAMRITLGWALRQSGAEAGLIGLVGEDGVHIIASEGYAHELDAYRDSALPVRMTPLRNAVQTGQIQRIISAANLPSEDRLLTYARSQLVIPIRRENTVMGILVLESTRPEAGSDEAVEFLTRLGDHASIAIANAQLYAAVQSANAAKSEFVSFVAHELKNPMTSIKGYTELLAAGAVGPVSPPQANFLATIRSNIDRMNTLVSDLTDLTKIEAGRLRLDFKSFQASEAAEEAVRSIRRQVDGKGQQLQIPLPAGMPPVWADQTRLVQVLVNLLSNAHKYTPQGGKIIMNGEVSANLWDSLGAARVIHLWVKDNGIGINEEDQKKIFQKFFRSEDPKTREAPGTGLGLNITRSLVEMQGGRIWFESEFRQGTTFHITVPVAE